MGKCRRVYMTVDVDLGEALDEMTDEMLLEAVSERKLKLGRNDFDPIDDLRDMHEELLRGRPAEALAILERLIHPKWHSTNACETELKGFLASVGGSGK